MKVSYYGYGVLCHNTNEKSLIDLRDFFRSFCLLQNNEFKNGFIINDDHVYLVHEVDDVYLFLNTKNGDLIKKINTSQISIEEIHTLLGQDEQICFASYVLIKENYFGFASTIFAPKFGVFSGFVNMLFSCLGIKDLSFYTHPLLHQATKEEAKTFSHIGRTTIELDKENTFVESLLNQFGFTDQDTFELDGVEITIKPKRGRNIKDAVEKVMDHLPEDGLEKFVMRAKSEIGSNVTDLYLTGLGAVSDIITNRDERKIPELLERKSAQNELLRNKLAEFVQDENFDEMDVDSILHYSDVDSWASRIRDI